MSGNAFFNRKTLHWTGNDRTQHQTDRVIKIFIKIFGPSANMMQAFVPDFI